MKNISKNKKGFTLVEILFSVAIFTLILGAITLFGRNLWVYNSFITSGFVNADAERQLLQTMVSEIRTASIADNGAYPISLATSSAFTFFSDIDNDGLKEQIRYFLSGTTLEKGVTKSTGSPAVYNSANEKITVLAPNVTSDVFAYYDKNYDGTTAALAFPVNVPDIRLVKITITLDKDPNRSPVPSTFTTQVSIRNLKDNL